MQCFKLVVLYMMHSSVLKCRLPNYSTFHFKTNVSTTSILFGFFVMIFCYRTEVMPVECNCSEQCT